PHRRFAHEARVIAAVVLAAGASTRYGSPKQAVLVEPIVRRVRQSREIADVVVVLGAHDVETSERIVRCADWELGPGASLRCGLAALDPEVEAAVVVLADGPELASATIDRLIAVWQGEPVLAASYGGVRGH